MQLASRLSKLEESATLAMSRLARELKAQGKDIISLSLGEPDFHTPQFIKDAAIEALNNNFTTYPPVPGYDDLRDAIVEKFKRDNGLNYKRENIIVSTGAKQSIANVVFSCVGEGDEVLIPAPYWVSYIEIVKMADGVPVVIPTTMETDFKLTADALEKAITPKTKMLIYSSPCNPTGSVYSYDELKALAAVIEKYPDLIVISDEIYEHINFKGKHESLAQFDAIFNQVVTINGVSKAWAMTGWRLGYIGAPVEIANACNKIQGQFTSGTNSIAQKAAVAAVKADVSVLTDMVAAFKNRRDLCLRLLNEIPGMKCSIPDGAFYLFPDISAYFGKKCGNTVIRTANDLSMYLLDEANVALVTGEAFGNEKCIRISYATSENILEEAISRIKIALAKLQ
ncbi:MAG: pyridoxal phosphate-dependent aminotransferase [Flavobacteriia bacterium]|nr:pyridoxal phosphate-dependent aminotransferase [Flavobacteriia bacterium]OJX37078.1 MAG: aspartate aminotransferase [Flavobacteriia bacterium 40-80]